MKRFSLFLAAALAAMAIVPDAEAGWLRGRSASTTRIRVRTFDRGRYCCPVPAAAWPQTGAPCGPTAPASPTVPMPKAAAPTSLGSAAGVEPVDALDLVNQLRVQRGLRPFVRDDSLTAGAFSCVAARAGAGRPGHSANDFVFLPPGAAARASGCEAQPYPDWGACCTFDNYTHAGAAYVNAGGGMYCQIFVR